MVPLLPAIYLLFLLLLYGMLDFVNNDFILLRSSEFSTSYANLSTSSWSSLIISTTRLFFFFSSVTSSLASFRFLDFWLLFCFSHTHTKTVYCCLDHLTLEHNASDIIISQAFKPFTFIWSYKICCGHTKYTRLFEDFQQVRTCSY